MFLRAAEIAPDALVDADVCIVGSGPAGVTLALELAGRGIRVVQLESGSLTPRKRDQHLGVGDIVSSDDAYAAQRLEGTRIRGFGGTGNAWNAPTPSGRRHVRLVPLESVDFQARDWIPDSGWPFPRRELEPFYRRAAQRFGIDPDAWDAAEWASSSRPLMALHPTLVTTRIFQFAEAAAYRARAAEALRRAWDVTVVLGATVTHLEHDGQQVHEVRAVSGRGRHLRVAARVVVLACGTIENARLLLASAPGDGAALGNAHDVVGRYFMDHPAVRAGVLLPARSTLVRRAGLYDVHLARRPRDDTPRPIVAKLVLAADAQRARRTLHSAFQLFGRPLGYSPERMERLKRMVDDHDAAALLRAFTGQSPHRIGGVELSAARRWLRGRLNMGWSDDGALLTRPAMLEVAQKSEQAPDRDNRVVLGSERDALGCRVAELRWRWTERDRRSAALGQQILADAVADAGLGHLLLERDALDQPVLSRGTNHHLGTTRMHRDPRRGVVDADGRVHGVANLFIAGASTFPTGGYANPTLTITALAIRLADHLRHQVLVPEQIVVGAAS